MENQINIQATEVLPHILFDKSKGELLIEGRSMPEDAYAFFEPVLDWLEKYVQAPAETTICNINLDYFNSGSVKQVFTILCMLEDILETSLKVSVNWRYEKGDELMQSKGIEFNKFLDIDILVNER